MKRNDYYNFKNFTHELLIDLNDAILKNDLSITQTTINIITKGEYYYHGKMLIDTIRNYIYFGDKKIIEDYYNWRYRVYYFRDINLDFLVYEALELQKICKFYLPMSTLKNIENIFSDIEILHTLRIKNITQKNDVKYLDKVEQIYRYAINGDGEKLYTTMYQDIINLEDLCMMIDNDLSLVMTKIGQEWEQLKISIAKEHLASVTIESVIVKIFNKIRQHPSNNKRVLITTGMKEYHKLGVTIGTLLLEKLGYDVISLGSDIPLDELKNILYEIEPQYMINSITLLSHLDEIDLLVRDIKKEFHQQEIIFIGAGNGLRSLSDPSNLLSFDMILNGYKQLYDECV